ncbi:MAG: NAD-dependent epimerase/dehydratase family protein [Verrucomicrobiota bacterium]
MKWLITGGAGFIGTNLIKALRAKGESDIRVFDDLSVGSREDLGSACSFEDVAATDEFGGVQLVVGSIMDAPLMADAAKGADVVVHLAANTGVGPSVEDPRSDCTTNVIGTLNALEAARHGAVKRFVFASSGAPVGECEPPIHEEKVPRPVSPYGASKLAGEGYCSAYFRTFGLETVGLRFGNVYGPGSTNKGSVVAKFIRLAREGKTLEIYGDGQQTRDFIYVEDLVGAIVQGASAEGAGGELFQIATNRESTVSELVELLVPLLDERGLGPVEVMHGEKRLGDVMRNFSDTTKAKEVLGWSSETELANGLRKTVDWFFSA